MRARLWQLFLLFACVVMALCASFGATCNTNTAILPAHATADHKAAVPGNQVQFSLSSTVEGNCPLIPDRMGEWSSSDPASVTISNQGLATCLNATPAPVTISYSGMVRGRPYPSAALVCK